LERARAESLRRLRAFARRQEAWFRRDPRVVWIRADRSDLAATVHARLGDTATARACDTDEHADVGQVPGARERLPGRARRPGGRCWRGGDERHSHDHGASGTDRVGELARALCERHTGVGADGLLVLRSADSGGEVRMELRNADGGRAETSGNGLRCFALSVIEAGLVPGPQVAIETDVGVRQAVVASNGASGCAEVSVEMGCLKVTSLSPVADVLLPGSVALPWPAWFVDAGNPISSCSRPRCTPSRSQRSGRCSRGCVKAGRTSRS